MELPALLNWTNTRDGLHQAAEVIGAVRAAVAQPQPNWNHLGLDVIPQGITTGTLPVGELVLDLTAQTVLYKAPDRELIGFGLARHSQQSLADAVVRGLAAAGNPVTVRRDKLTGDGVFDIDPQHAADYAQVLYRLSETFKRFRASLRGMTTPVILWPHGFDLSFLWFATDQTSEEAPHMAFGFSPGSAGLDRPYVYAYLYPIPEGLTDHELPPFTLWHTQGWTGVVWQYDELAKQQTPDSVVEDTLLALYTTLAPALR